jgi:hypothetical protein
LSGSLSKSPKVELQAYMALGYLLWSGTATVTGTLLNPLSFLKGVKPSLSLFHSCQYSFLGSVPESDRLPSDCSFRRDVMLMKEGRMQEAQDQKTAIEELQRKDRRLRAAAAKD